MASLGSDPGPSGLRIEANIAVTLRATGNGNSTNGSSNTPHRRKWPRNPENWKKSVAKAKRAKGEEYTSPCTGMIVPARATGPNCHCKMGCFERVSTEERARLLDAFNALANKDLQDVHLFGLIQSNPIKRRRPRDATSTPRLAAYTYSVSWYSSVFFFEKLWLNIVLQVRVGGSVESVCQKAFASLYGVSISRARRIAQATSTSICAPVDKRGKHPRASRSARQSIKDHSTSMTFYLPFGKNSGLTI